MNFPKFSVKRPITITMVVFITIIFGVLSFSRLSLDLLPDIDFPTVSVTVSYPGVMPEDIEELVTKPIEDAVATIEGVDVITSSSQEGFSLVVIEFESNIDVDIAAQDVRDKISTVESSLPENAGKPYVLKTDLGAMPILIYGINAEGTSSLELSEIIEDNIKDKLERLNGVASVVIQGGGEREIQVVVEKTKLEFYELNQGQVISVLEAENLNNSGGFIEQGLEEISVRTVGEYKSLDDIENIILTFKNGVPIYLRDIADVSWSEKERRGYVRTNQNDSVILSVNKQSGANTVEVVQAIEKELPQIKQYLPKNANFFLVMDQSSMINASLDSTKQSGIIGAFLAIAVVYIFLRNWRPTLVIAVGIPLAVIATFIPIYVAGYSLNVMTLGGLALGIGMLVDNAVVVIENIFRHLDKSGKRKKAAILGTTQVMGAIIASTITTIAVFLPMSLTTGIAGQLARGLSLTVIFSLVCSLIVAITAVPMIASKVFRDRTQRGLKKDESSELTFLTKIKKIYKKTLVWSLQNRVKSIVFTFILLLITVGLYPFIGAEFMNEMEQGVAIFQASMPVGTSLKETREVSKELEAMIENKIGDQITSVTAVIGENENLAESGGLGGSANDIIFIIHFKDKKDRTIPEKEAVELVRVNKPPVRGLEFSVYDMATSMMGGGSNPVEIKVLGNNLEKIKEASRKIEHRIKVIEGIRDVEMDYDEGKPELQINIDRQKAAYLGLNVAQIGQEIANSMQGVIASEFRQNGEETNIRVRLSENYRDDLEALKDLTIISSNGNAIALKQVASISRENGPSEINREDQLRVITVTANILDRDIKSIMSDIQVEIENESIPDGVYIEYGGSYEQMTETFSSLALALILAIVLVYMVMAAQFESFLYPLIVMFEVPLAFIGVGWSLFISGQSLSLPAFLGIIMLAGIVVNNAIVLVDYVNQLRERGKNINVALIEAGTNRLRPILITSITTLLGLVPMAFSNVEGSEMMKPMAIVVIGGLLVSTVLTLVIIPVMYSLADQFSKKEYGNNDY